MSSFSSKLKMRCSISRIPDNPESLTDDQGMYEPSFQSLYSDIPCFMMYLRLAAGKLQVKEEGQDDKNEIICMLDNNIAVKTGDRIDCLSFYPYEFYVDSVNPIVSGRTGVVHHFECIMSLEKKN